MKLPVFQNESIPSMVALKNGGKSHTQLIRPTSCMMSAKEQICLQKVKEMISGLGINSFS